MTIFLITYFIIGYLLAIGIFIVGLNHKKAITCRKEDPLGYYSAMFIGVPVAWPLLLVASLGKV